VFHVINAHEANSNELLLAVAGAADSLHSFIADFMEFFAKTAEEEL
jgi:hypothetical protein